jgi:hypothetical protein
MDDIDAMSLEAIQAELREPSEEHRERRARLWQRLDALLGVRKPAIARPVAG